MSNIVKWFLFASLSTTVLLAIVSPVSAQTTMLVEAVPTAWRIQSFVNSGVTMYYTGYPCVSGSIALPATAPAADQDRLWSLLLSARFSGKTIGIYYNYDGGAGCTVTSYYVKEGS